MTKEQNYHIAIENLETGQKESFLLNSNYESPLKVSGSDNLAPKYQIGKMEYGDLTNHSVWAQSDWSEGGGKKYWDPYRDGYDVYPYTKKYFSKSGLRTIDYPGELRLGANAEALSAFPQTTGKVVKIINYGVQVYVAVNLENSCEVHKTIDGGLTWTKVYDSVNELYNEVSSGTKLSEFSDLCDITVGSPDATDRIFQGRYNPNNGQLIPLTDYDNWYQERRNVLKGTFVYMTLRKPGYGIQLIVRIPITSYQNIKQHGLLIDPVDFTIQDKKDDYITGYAAETVQDLLGSVTKVRRANVGAINAQKFYPGQMVDFYSGGDLLGTHELAGISGDYLVFKSDLPLSSTLTLKHSSQTLVIIPSVELPSVHNGKDFQGNSVNLHPFDFEIRNLSNNKIGYVSVSSGEYGLSHADIIYGNLYQSYNHLRQVYKSPSSMNLYVTYNSETYERGSIGMDSETRSYLIIKTAEHGVTSSDFNIGDNITLNQTVIVGDFGSAKPIIGIYQRKNPDWNEDNVEAREYDLYYSQGMGSTTYICKAKFPCDIIRPSNNEIMWVSMAGNPTAHFLEETSRVISIGAKNPTMVQSYLYELDDTKTGALVPILSVGEESISALVKLNESTYLGTNNKGRIYNWNGQSYEVMQRFDLDPVTNSTDIGCAFIFQNKILFPDNFNGNIMSFDPEEGTWDDICAPEYLKESGDLITAIGAVGGELFFGTNKASNLMWKFDETITSGSGHLISSWYSADMPAMDKKGLYVQILAHTFIESTAKVRLAVQFDYQDTWYYLAKKRGQELATAPTAIHELNYNDFKSVRAFYLFFPYNTPKFKTARYRVEVESGEYEEDGVTKIFRPVISNIDLFYILSDPKELLFTFPIKLEGRLQTLGGPGSDEIGRHKNKLAFLLDIWNNDSIVRITNIDGTQYHCIPFKPQQLQGGGMSVFYNNLNAAKKDLDELSYLVNIMFKSINKIDNFGE